MLPEEIDVGRHGLVLRSWRLEHAPTLLAAIQASVAELRRFMPWATTDPTLAAVLEFVGSVVDGPAIGYGLFEADGELVGGCGLHDRRGPGILEIGYWVRSDRTGRGYATAVARALTTVALERFPEVNRVEIRCDPANLASAAIPPKLGYRLVEVVDAPIEATAQTGRQQVWALTRTT
jgi:RimJ/RimL family protein N-acetyltransferase